MNRALVAGTIILILVFKYLFNCNRFEPYVQILSRSYGSAQMLAQDGIVRTHCQSLRTHLFPYKCLYNEKSEL